MLLASPRSIVLLILNWMLWLPLIFFTWYSSMYVFLVSAVFSELHSLTRNLLCSTCWQCFCPILNSSVFLFVCANYCCCETCQGCQVDFIVRWCNSEAAFFFSCSIRTNLMRAFFFQHATVFSTPAAELELKCSSRPQQISAEWRRFTFPNSLSLPLECSFAPCILQVLCAGWGCAFLLYLIRYVIQEWAIITSLRCLSWVWTWAIQVKLHWLCCILIGRVFCYQQTI